MRKVGILAVVVCAVASTGAHAAGGAAPAYPGNSLLVESRDPITAGTVVRVRVSGHAEWPRPSAVDQNLSLYVQDADVDGRCEPTYGGQLAKSINLPGLNASRSPTGFVLLGGYQISAHPPGSATPNTGTDWSTDSVVFSVRPGVRGVLLCAYQRFVTDDVAWFELPVAVRLPACRISGGAPLRLSCNFRGTLTVTIAGAGVRRVRAAATDGDGVATVALPRLSRGTYAVRVSDGARRVGAGRLRVA